MANAYKNKVIYNGNTLIDISDTTAVASDVNAGKDIYLASGQKVTGTQVVYSVLKTLSHISASNEANKVIGNGTFYSELMPEEGHSITSVTVTMNGNDITDSVFTGYDGTVEGYSLTSSLTHCFFTDVETTKSSFYAVLNAELGYESPQVIITVGGVDMSNYYSSGVINIPNVTGNIVITAVAAQAVVSSITAVFTQGSAVIYDTDSLDTLKQYLVVTANYENGTSGVVTGYTLSGTLAEGTSTITVSFGGKTTTFNVTVSIYDTSPIIAAENRGLGMNGQSTAFNGLCITQIYHYQQDVESLMASSGYDATNDYITIANLLPTIIINRPRTNFDTAYPSATGVGNATKNHIYKEGDVYVTYSSGNTNYGNKNSTDWRITGVAFTLFLPDVNESYAYWNPSTTAIYPIGVRGGDIIFAGRNTPYFGLKNIDEAST